jgi:hypothetical protein
MLCEAAALVNRKDEHAFVSAKTFKTGRWRFDTPQHYRP